MRSTREGTQRPRPAVLPLALLGVLVAAVAVVSLALRALPNEEDPAAARAPAAPPAAATVTTEGFRVWAVDADGEPLRWDPCAPVEFVVAEDLLPEGAVDDVRRALDLLAGATGLDLRLIGVSRERPSPTRPLVVRTDSGWRYAPVLIAWERPGRTELPLTDADRGLALPVAVQAAGREAFVTGQVLLNADRVDLVLGFGDRRDAWGATLLHELAHVLGLDHVDDQRELMSRDPGSGPVLLGPGDRAGLARIGADHGCVPTPTPGAARGLTPRGIAPER
jgi:hypothetical protein